ncbi:hypothetical protein ZOSMA_38G00170 [Zostera marina]|uniref:UV-B-induced protein n=1 Tax=Zostera marina TaxID=29655 RepID=A0A0K9P6T8_ZOSMR|nr:hypothetical protein ZOSMA_38G00170 [Zostera marina]
MDATTAVTAVATSFVGSYSLNTPVVSQGLFLKSSRVFLPGQQRKSVAFSTGWLKSESWKHGHGGRNLSSTAIKAASSNSVPTDPTDSSSLSIAPLRMESPVGQFLSQILANHPHLLPAAVEKQLEQLEIDLEKAEKNNKDDATVPSTELVLYKRIAELKANERKRTLEEILYALVVQKFMEAEVRLVPAITLHSNPSSSSSSSSSQPSVDVWTAEDDKKLKSMHSTEAYEMIENHLHLILGQRLGDSNSIAPPISKLRVGQVYAASVMYGYFLKRVDQRFQLEKKLKSLPSSSLSDSDGVGVGDATNLGGGFGLGMKSTPLRTYVMSFDSETLQTYASIRSKEAFSIIEKHTEALFGKSDSVSGNSSNKDEVVKISIAGLKRLVLEAVTFRSFLWDVESHVDSRYRFVSVSS